MFAEQGLVSPESFRWVGWESRNPVLAGPLMLPWFCSDPARSHGHRSFMAGTCGGCLPGPPLEIVGKKLALGTNCGQGLGSVCLQQTLWGLHLDYSSLVFPDFSPWELAGIPPPLPHLPGEGAGSWMVQDLVMKLSSPASFQ